MHGHTNVKLPLKKSNANRTSGFGKWKMIRLTPNCVYVSTHVKPHIEGENANLSMVVLVLTEQWGTD